MLATPHMIAGAAIGRKLGRPWLALPAAFLGHFLLDAVPHLDSHALFGNATGRPTTPEAAMAVLDAALGTATVLWAARGQPSRRLMLASALLGIAIDLVDNVPPWNAWFRAWPAGAWLSRFHHSHQHNVTPGQWPLGFGTQMAALALAAWLMRGPDPARPGMPGKAGPSR